MGSDVSEGLGRVGTSAVDAFVAGLEEIDGVDPRVAAILQSSSGCPVRIGAGR